MRLAKAFGLAVAMPATFYWVVFHHFGCEADAEQLVAAVLGFAGLGAAIRWA